MHLNGCFEPLSPNCQSACVGYHYLHHPKQEFHYVITRTTNKLVVQGYNGGHADLYDLVQSHQSSSGPRIFAEGAEEFNGFVLLQSRANLLPKHEYESLHVLIEALRSDEVLGDYDTSFQLDDSISGLVQWQDFHRMRSNSLLDRVEVHGAAQRLGEQLSTISRIYDWEHYEDFHATCSDYLPSQSKPCAWEREISCIDARVYKITPRISATNCDEFTEDQEMIIGHKDEIMGAIRASSIKHKPCRLLLEFAIRNNLTLMLRRLIQYGADVNDYIHGKSPPTLATEIGSESMIHILLSQGADFLIAFDALRNKGPAGAIGASRLHSVATKF